MSEDSKKKSLPKGYKNWKEYNEELVRRGELLFDTDFLATWRSELKKMNEGKEGAPFAYPGSFLNMLAAHPRVPTSVQAAGRVRKAVLTSRKRTKGKRATLHDDMVESDKDGDRPRSEDKPE